MTEANLKDQEFTQFQELIYRIAGISLADSKKALVSGRLAKRLKHLQLSSYGEYFKLLTSAGNKDEMQMAVDLLTTNETYFFREPKHFDFLRDKILPAYAHGRPFRVWSAASSTGQEAYSIAMLLADGLADKPWEIMASDISVGVLNKASSGHYPLEQAKNIQQSHLKRYCLKGTGPDEGTFLIDRSLRSKIKFTQVNLNVALPQTGEFDLVFLRNVMIYFDNETKRQVVLRIMERMRPGAHLFIGHSESLNGIVDELQMVAPSIFRIP